jgi:capsular polysaccharide transport system permease protein
MSGRAGPLGLAGAFGVQRRVIGALVIREMQTRFGRHNLGFLWLFGEPMLLALAISAIHSASGHHLPNGISTFVFSVMGYVPYFMFRSIVNRAAGAIHANLTLMFHRQVKIVDVMIARSLLEAAACTGVIVIILLVFGAVMGEWPANPLLLGYAMLLSALIGHGLALIVAVVTAQNEAMDRLVHAFTYMMMPLSGAFFMVDILPPETREMFLWIPLPHIHEALRASFFGDRITSHYDLFYATSWVVMLNMIGLLALRSVRPKLEMF